jgi:hypothetical protein
MLQNQVIDNVPEPYMRDEWNIIYGLVPNSTLEDVN